MSDHFNLGHARSTRAPATREVFSPQSNLRPQSENLTEISDDEADYCVIRSTLPAGAVVPMHSHADRETFYVLAGRLNAYNGDRWQELGPGDVLDVQDGIKHAWRNSSKASASMLCVTTTKMARFLRDISISATDSSPEAQAQRFLQLVKAHGYWLASPEENAAVGLKVNWSGPGD